MVRSVTADDEVDQVAADTSTTPVSRVINLTERLDRSTKRFAEPGGARNIDSDVHHRRATQ